MTRVLLLLTDSDADVGHLRSDRARGRWPEDAPEVVPDARAAFYECDASGEVFPEPPSGCERLLCVCNPESWEVLGSTPDVRRLNTEALRACLARLVQAGYAENTIVVGLHIRNTRLDAQCDAAALAGAVAKLVAYSTAGNAPSVGELCKTLARPDGSRITISELFENAHDELLQTSGGGAGTTTTPVAVVPQVPQTAGSLALFIHPDRVLRETLAKRWSEAGGQSRHRGLPVLEGRISHVTADAYSDLAGWIERQVESPAALRNALAVIDLDASVAGQANPISMKSFDPMRPEGGANPWASVVAALVLTFPEVHWAFLTSNPTVFDTLRPEIGGAKEFRAAHVIDAAQPDLGAIGRLRAAGFVPLFDPTGLRDLIRRNILDGNQRADRDADLPDIPVRRQTAAAIDEEKDFAYLMAYVAYRFGYRVHSVTTHRMMDRLFGKDRTSDVPAPAVAFEDLRLDFADSPNHDLSDLVNGRHKQYPWLTQKDTYRVFVTAGMTRTSDRYYCEALEAKDLGVVLRKPLSGIFNVWEMARMYSPRRNGKTGGREKDYHWPPERATGTETYGHSAPGRLQEIVARLLARGQSLADTPGSVLGAVHGAVLGLDAQELLGGRTPMTTFAGLAVQHECEVQAECLFYGIEAEFDVGRRCAEVRTVAEAAGKSIEEKERAGAVRTTVAAIFSQLALLFRNANQFDEEFAIQGEARWVKLWNPRPWANYVGKHAGRSGAASWMLPRAHAAWDLTIEAAAAFPKAYFALITTATWKFFAALMFWVLVFSLLFAHAGPTDWPYDYWPRWLLFSTATFFGLGTPDLKAIFGSDNTFAPANANLFACAVTCELVCGFFHLGILISLLYTRLTRR